MQDRRQDQRDEQGYDERLWAPWWLWLLAALFALSVGLAYGFPLGAGWGLLAGLASGAAAAWGLVASAARVRVAGRVLQAGRARLPLSAAGLVVPLDAEQARRLRGPEADPAAYTLIRGWVPTGVRVDVNDPGDPTPYWYVSTRRPEALASALEAARRA